MKNNKDLHQEIADICQLLPNKNPEDPLARNCQQQRRTMKIHTSGRRDQKEKIGSQPPPEETDIQRHPSEVEQMRKMRGRAEVQQTSYTWKINQEAVRLWADDVSCSEFQVLLALMAVRGQHRSWWRTGWRRKAIHHSWLRQKCPLYD